MSSEPFPLAKEIKARKSLFRNRRCHQGLGGIAGPSSLPVLIAKNKIS
jgi:hypothetical protein